MAYGPKAEKFDLNRLKALKNTIQGRKEQTFI
jgi:hypothetical protein